MNGHTLLEKILKRRKINFQIKIRTFCSSENFMCACSSILADWVSSIHRCQFLRCIWKSLTYPVIFCYPTLFWRWIQWYKQNSHYRIRCREKKWNSIEAMKLLPILPIKLLPWQMKNLKYLPWWFCLCFPETMFHSETFCGRQLFE